MKSLPSSIPLRASDSLRLEAMRPTDCKDYFLTVLHDYANAMLLQGEYSDFATALILAKKEITNYYLDSLSEEQHFFYYIYCGQQRVGLLSFSSLIFVDYIYIDPIYRGRGYARLSLEWLIQWAKEQGFNTISLNVMHYRQEAIQLYQSLGFKMIAERRLRSDASPTRFDMIKLLN